MRIAGLVALTVAWSIAGALGLDAAAVHGFSVQDTNGRQLTYTAGQVTVVVFVSTRCPISNGFNFRLNSLYQQFSRQTHLVVLDSNANESAEEVRTHAKDMEYDFPVYLDPGNAVADLLGARGTPESFVLDREGKIIYRGYIEDSPNPERARNPALRLAIEAALQNRLPPLAETHGRGCAIRRLQPGL